MRGIDEVDNMSEDDIDMLGSDGQSSRIDRDRRAPRFSWSPAYEETFFRSLCDSVQLGLRENSSFKTEVWDRAAIALQEIHGTYPAKSHLINKSDNARKRFRLWRGLREDPDFVYDPVERTVTASEDAWRIHIEREPLSRALRGRSFAHEDFMEILYPDVIGSGGAPKRIMKTRRRVDGIIIDEVDTPGAGVLNLQIDSSPSHAVEVAERQCAAPAMPSTSVSMPAWTATGQPGTDEPTNQAKKRAFPHDAAEGTTLAESPPSSCFTSINVPAGSPGKRVRTAIQVDASSAGDSAIVTTGSASSLPAPSPSNTTPLSAPTVPAHVSEAAWEEPETTKNRSGLQWQEMAVDLYFREFGHQDFDLQIRITESILRDEHRALVFCKMPWRLRQYWVSKWTEAHHRRS